MAGKSGVSRSNKATPRPKGLTKGAVAAYARLSQRVATRTSSRKAETHTPKIREI